MAPPNKKLAPAAWDALAEALATYEWYKRPFESLVRQLAAGSSRDSSTTCFVSGICNLAPPTTLITSRLTVRFTFRTDDQLLEARWWKENIQPKELNDFKAKVDGEARNTLGLRIAVSGFTPGAIEEHSSAQSPLILIDGVDLMPVLEGRISLDEVLERKRRHAAETGNVLFRVPL